MPVKKGRKKNWAIAIATGAVVFFVFSFLNISNHAYCYDSRIAHPNIGELAARLYNAQGFQPQLTEQQIAWIKQGAEEEDTPPRWLNHFYDPINNQGVFYDNEWSLSAKNWVNNSQAQRGFVLGDCSWQRALNDLQEGYDKEAFLSLGHVIHLISDMAVPAHTRDDIHIAGDSYEQFVKNNWNNLKNNFTGAKFISVSSLDEVFDNLAKYSNSNFYSDDTIEDEKYKKIEIYNQTKFNYKNKNYFYNYTKNKEGNYRVFISEDNWLGIKESEKFLNFLGDGSVLVDYSELLVPKAIGNSAGVIKLFFDKADEGEYKNLSWLRLNFKGLLNTFASKIIKSAKNLWQDVFSSGEENIAKGEEAPTIEGRKIVRTEDQTTQKVNQSSVNSKQSDTGNKKLENNETKEIVEIPVEPTSPKLPLPPLPRGSTTNTAPTITAPILPTVYYNPTANPGHGEGSGNSGIAPSSNGALEDPSLEENTTATNTATISTSTLPTETATSTCTDAGSCVPTSTLLTETSTSTPTSTEEISTSTSPVEETSTSTPTTTPDSQTSTSTCADALQCASTSTLPVETSTSTVTSTCADTGSCATTTTPEIIRYVLLKNNLAITFATSVVDNVLTLSAANSPYLIDYETIIPAGLIVKVDPGAVIVGYDRTSFFNISGELQLNGTAEAPIIFTSALDTNYFDRPDLTTLTGGVAAGDWSRLEVKAGGRLLANHTKFFYGGSRFYVNPGWVYGQFMSQVIRNIDGTVELNNAEFDNNYLESVVSDVDYNTDVWNESSAGGLANLAVDNSSFKNGNMAIKNSNFNINASITNSSFDNFIHVRGPLQSQNGFAGVSNNTLTNNVNNFINYGSWTISQDTTLNPGTDYLFTTIEVPVGKILTINPGVVLTMNGGDIEVKGMLQANGTAELPIEIKPKDALWGIMLFENSTSTLNYVNLSSGNHSSLRLATARGMITAEDSNLQLNSLNLTDSERPESMVYLKNSIVDFKNSNLIWTSPWHMGSWMTRGITMDSGSLHLDNVSFNRMDYGIIINYGGVITGMDNMTSANFQLINYLNWWPATTWTMK